MSNISHPPVLYKRTKTHILTANSILKGISCLLSLHSQRSEEPGAHGPQWPVRPLRQAQTDPRSQEWEQAEDQDHQMLPQSCLEWKLHLVRHSCPALQTFWSKIVHKTNSSLNVTTFSYCANIWSWVSIYPKMQFAATWKKATRTAACR